MLTEIGKALIISGVVLLTLGLLLTFIPSFRLSRLPGDIYIQRENWSIYIPVTTCIVLSIVLSCVFWIVSFLRR